MESVTTFGWALLLMLCMGAGFLGGALLLHWHGRKQLIGSLNYILDRLKVVELDLHRLEENDFVLRELLIAKGFIDDEDLMELRRELIERPRQIEAERAELLKQAQDEDVVDRLVKDVPDTLH